MKFNTHYNQSRNFSGLLIAVLFFVLHFTGDLSAQDHQSNNDYTGSWSDPASWAIGNGNIVNGDLINIYGYVTLNGNLNLNNGRYLDVYDTLVVTGDMTINCNFFGPFSMFTVHPGGLLIVLGDITGTHFFSFIDGNMIVLGEVNLSNWFIDPIDISGHLYLYDDTPTINPGSTGTPEQEEDIPFPLNNFFDDLECTYVDVTPPSMSLPAIPAIECITAVPSPYANYAALVASGGTASDNCSLNTASFVLVSNVSDGNSCPEVITRIYRIDDNSGNQVSATQSITIDDNTAPSVTGSIAPSTVEGCSAAGATAAVNTVAALEGLGLTISDACTPDASLVVTHSDASAGTCPITVTRTYTVTDACANAATYNQTIYVDDNTAPSVTGSIAPTTVEGCSAAGATAAVNTVAALEGLGLTISDACTSDASLVVTHSDASAGTCPITVTRTYTVTDACANATTYNQTIYVDDNTAPSITGSIAPSTVEGCSAAGATAAVNTVAALEGLGLTISDVCTPDASLVVTHSDASAGTCPITVTRTYTVTDACANAATYNQTIYVDDNTAPSITGSIAPTTVEGCSAAGATAAVNTVAALEGLGLTISDACTPDASLVVTHSDASAGTCPITVTRTYTVTDPCANAATYNQTIYVDDNTAPSITGSIAPSTVEGCSAAGATAAVNTVAALEGLGLTISDVCTPDASLVVTHSDASAGTCPITVTRTYTVTDACANARTYNQTIYVDDNTAPSITGSIAPSTVEGCSAAGATAAVNTVTALEGLGLTISDACTPDASLVVTHSDASAGTCPITVTRTYTVTDACANARTYNQTIYVDDNTAPSITGSIAPSTVEGCSAAGATAAVNTVAALEGLGLTISDVCTPDASLVVTHSDASAGTCPITVTRTYTVTDPCANATTYNQTIYVDDNTAPSITGSIAPSTVEGCSAAGATAAVNTVAALEGLGLTISDACTPDASLVVTHSDASAGTCPITVTRTYTVTDACANARTYNQTIYVDDNTAPSITGSIAPTTVEGCSAAGATAAVNTVAALEALGLSISDACTPDASLVVTHSDASAGTCPITVTRTYTVTDACANSRTYNQTIYVDDNTAPNVTGSIAPTTVEGCSAAGATAAVNTVAALEALGLAISDVCTPDASLVVTHSDASAGTCPITVTRTYTVTDACANARTYNQTIYVDDNTAPSITGSIAPSSVEGCSAAGATAAVNTVAALEGLGLSISDACTPDASLVVTHSDASAGTCPITVTRTYTVTDACANAATYNQTIYVDDNTAPSITGSIAPSTVEGCSAAGATAAVNTVAALEALGLAISDACTPDASLVVTHSDASAGTCPITVTRTYTVTDACANASTYNQTIYVDDNTAPSITGSIAPSTVEGCSAAGATAAVNTVAALEGLGLTISDACTPDASLVVTHSDASAGTCPITVTRTYTVTDACANAATYNQTIYVDDNTAPSVTGSIAPTTVEGCSAAGATAAVNTVSALEALGLAISDACTPDASLLVTHSDASAGTSPIIVTRTYTISDVCGNFDIYDQTIQVSDNIEPVIVCPEDITICSNNPAGETIQDIGLDSYSDNCTLAADLLIAYVISGSTNASGTGDASGTFFNTGISVLEYTVTDESSNSSSCSFTVSISSRPVTSDITGNATPACEASNVAYSVISTLNSKYRWTVPSGTSITSDTTGLNKNSISVNFGNMSGDITVAETNASGCIGDTKYLSIELQGCDFTPDFESNHDAICIGDTITVLSTSTGVNGTASYAWDFGSSALPASATGPGPHNVYYTSIGTKTISLSVTQGVIKSVAKDILVSDLPEITLTGIDRCGAGDALFTATPVNANSVDFSLDGGSTIIYSDNTSPYEYTYPLNVGESISVWAMANNTIGGCTSGWSQGIEILALEAPVTGTIVINSPANPGSYAQYFDLACRSEIRNYSVVPVPGSNYRWRIPSLDIDTLGINSIDVPWDLQEGEYTLILQEISSEGCEGTLRQEWIYVSDPVLELGPDQSICHGDSIILQPEGNFNLYTWQNYSHQDTYVGLETGTVWLRVENEYSCQTSDTMTLEVHENPILFLGNDTMICDEAGYELVVEGFVTYLWSTGETDNSVIIYPGNTLISLEVTDNNSCSDTDSINISECGGNNLLGEITNTFTPNNDGIHDLWVINNIEQYPNAVIDIFDRTGRLIFHAQGYQNNWDGSFNGKPLLMDTYYYIIDFKNDAIKSLRGTVTIVRE